MAGIKNQWWWVNLFALLPVIIFFFIDQGYFNSNTTSLPSTLEQKEEALFIEDLLSKMTLSEKLGQLNQRGTSSREKGTLSEDLKQAVRQGKIGAMLNVMNHDNVREIQRLAVEESPNGIPMLFARDVIHGFRTIFPIPLGQAAGWDIDLVKDGAEVAAKEASSQGIRWTFAPMIDVSRDPRWGRIAESFGEDPYLNATLGAAMVEGFQGDLSQPYHIAACAKHFAGYGAAEGGRDYNTTNIPEALMRQVYLPPFQQAVEAGVLTFMAGFNELNGIPVSGNRWLLNEVLRQEWGFDGAVVSDWNSVTEMIAHGYAADDQQAAERAITAGIDMEMTSQAYEHHLETLLQTQKVELDQIDEAVRRILRVKYRLGLFNNPYADLQPIVELEEAHRLKAEGAAAKSLVLLKNEDQLLPLQGKEKIALIGPMADAALDQLGTWIFDGKAEESVTLLEAARESGHQVEYVAALDYSRDKSQVKFQYAIQLARRSDVIVLALGEEAILSGEAHSRADISLPGAQSALLKALSKLNKPIVTVLMAGRPLVLEEDLEHMDALIMAWHPGTMAGPAIWSVLDGSRQPSGKLPVTWPKANGQMPIYYNHSNTGRPATNQSVVAMEDIPVGAWQSSLGNTSHYLDAGRLPQWPFGFGMHYGEIQYSSPKLLKEVRWNMPLELSVEVQNVGKYPLEETVQLYLQDEVAEIVQPIKSLKAFQKVKLLPGESKEVSFSLPFSSLSYIGPEMNRRIDPGFFKIWLAPDAGEGHEFLRFEVIKKPV
ncbi:beta-glucosidase BglX [Persicobacter diffluens]|uniref:beta-glucosidase n=1 Tax=Persicobacter diffluens TaxID=981 RepID=A0AAN5AN49_9BACT|nr:glycosyl hydrolase [Persicobacter diffluens]